MFYQNYGPYYPYYYRRPESSFPPVTIEYFENSLTAYLTLLEHGRIVINSLVSSQETMVQLMEAAQASDDTQVDQIIKSTGVPSIVETTYTPTGVTFTLSATVGGSQCCRLTMFIRWGF
ncbi:hypothetical protein ACFFHM_03715 [Halalkalibacter kiskunsagensis]|uniref:Uncharacterized protein n=1 Tax=Halalkalibacter kiskunsagensis TaxID=1548599 RepID=A0ABV6K8N2_9BACI